ncbi:MAG: hypothetical protein CMG35_11350 [Candidatus Marinimicrobia bacterium]|nr:hypothetical protein [Candidatus Neomarinimicrobiota bacterium]|tara:strand:+ start:26117 stop:26542 length:426 start_codon:yes stop_codon:yes gene_type:complete
MNNETFQAPTVQAEKELDKLASKLTPFQRRFADVMAIGNVRSRAEAVRQAGSKAKRPSSVAHKLMQNPVILEYIRHAVTSRLGTDMVASAVHTMSQLIHEADEDKVRFAAAKDTLDRMGMRAPERKQVHHSGQVSVHIDLG